MIVAVVSVGAAQATVAPSHHEVAAIVPVIDPVDGWLGGTAGIEGDIALAHSVTTTHTTVSNDGSALRFEATGRDRSAAEIHLTEVLRAYEAARDELRRGLDVRLELLPSLAGYAEQRSLTIDQVVAALDGRLGDVSERAPAELRAERAAALAASDQFRERRGVLLEFSATLGPVWTSTPIETRLDRLDELLDEAFWFAAGDSA